MRTVLVHGGSLTISQVMILDRVLSQDGLEQDLETTIRPYLSQINPERVNVQPFTVFPGLIGTFGYYGFG